MAYKTFDVVVVPFPFTDQNTDKRRPALVLSGGLAAKDQRAVKENLIKLMKLETKL